jgi:hypothetical protein
MAAALFGERGYDAVRGGHFTGGTVIMGDKSPKAAKKQASQKQAKNDVADKKRKQDVAAKQVQKK